MIDLIYTCDKCKNKKDEFDQNLICDDCYDKEVNFDEIKKLIEKISNRKSWEDREHYVGFTNEKEKDIYLNGLKEGIWESLFEVADYFGDEGIGYFETLYHIFGKK